MGEAGGQIGPFRLVRRLGVGGMAEAFEAVRVSPGGLVQRVCIKRVLPAHADDPAFVRLFRREAEMAAGLHHAGIVAVLDIGEDDALPYLVLELVDGIDLRALLATTPERRLPADVVAYVATELADALAYAHRGDARGRRPAIVHRDVSPSNVLVGRAGEIKLADFGLAKAVDANPVTQSGTMRGKIPYMAPEHMRGGDVDGRMDLFALGVVLFEALAGRRPFDGAHDVETMTRILADQRPALLDLRPEVPAYLAAIVERLLAPDPRNRFASADALLDALADAGPLDHARIALAERVEARLGGVATRAHVAMNSDRDRQNAHWLAAVTPEERLPRAFAPEPRRPPPPPVPGASKTGGPATNESAIGPRTEQITRQVRREPQGDAPRRRHVLALAMVALGFAGGLGGATAAWVRTSRTGSSIAPSMAPDQAAGPGIATAPHGSATPRLGARTETGGAATTTGSPSLALAVTHESTTAIEARPPSARADAPPAASSATLEPAPASGTIAAMPRPASRSAAVRVFVHPWGSVWIDHRFVGRAPRTVELAPGSHLLEAGDDRPRTGRRIVVQAGERRSLDLELPPDP